MQYAMRAGRIAAWIVAALGVLVLIAGWGVPAAMSTPRLKSRVLAIASRAAGRPVGATSVRVAPFFSSVQLDGFTLAQPAGFPAGHALEADRISFRMGPWRLLRGSLVGSLDGRGVRANLLRRGGRTSLDGLGGAGGEGSAQPSGGKSRMRIDLDVSLADGRLVQTDLDTGESVTLDGVGLKTHFGGVDLPVTLRVREIDRGPLVFRDLKIDAVGKGGGWTVGNLATSLQGGGAITGHGRFDPAKGWQLALDAKAVELNGDLRPIAAALFPVLAAPGGDLAGHLDGSFDLSANGLTWNAVRRTLRGGGSASLRGAGATAGTVIERVAALAGLDPSAARLQDCDGAFRIEDGWIRFTSLRARAGDVPIDFGGRVSLTGALDVTTDLAPLVRRTGSGPFQRVAGSTKTLPVRITGTVTSPKVAPPSPAQLGPEAQRRVRDALQNYFQR